MATKNELIAAVNRYDDFWYICEWQLNEILHKATKRDWSEVIRTSVFAKPIDYVAAQPEYRDLVLKLIRNTDNLNGNVWIHRAGWESPVGFDYAGETRVAFDDEEDFKALTERYSWLVPEEDINRINNGLPLQNNTVYSVPITEPGVKETPFEHRTDKDTLDLDTYDFH